MKRTILLLIAALSTSLAFPQQKHISYIVEGSLSDFAYEGKMLYIIRLDDNQKIDSTRISNGTFRFTGKVTTPVLCRIDAGKKYSGLILENGNITVDMEKVHRASGTPLNDKLLSESQVTDKLIQELRDQQNKIREQFSDKGEMTRQLRELYQGKYRPLIMKRRLDLFRLHSNDAIGEEIIRVLANEANPEEMDQVFAQAGPKIMALKVPQKIKKRFDALRQTAEGKKFIDFEGKDANNQPLAFSAFIGKGKYTLVDFWASWCGPCRQETPVIAKVYQAFKDKGLEVIGVATWDKAANTKKAIQELNITWPQIFDAESKPSDAYGFNGIPQIMLFGPDGTIVARDLRGDAIGLKVKEVLSIP